MAGLSPRRPHVSQAQPLHLSHKRVRLLPSERRPMPGGSASRLAGVTWGVRGIPASLPTRGRGSDARNSPEELRGPGRNRRPGSQRRVLIVTPALQARRHPMGHRVFLSKVPKISSESFPRSPLPPGGSVSLTKLASG